MELIPLKSTRLQSGSDLQLAIQSALELKGEKLKEKDILIIASKVVAFSEKRLVKVKNQSEYEELVKKEADQILAEGDMVLTLKNKILIPNAGIDNSNTPEGEVVLWPEHPFQSARNIRQKKIKNYKIKNLGILISDSHCQPLRAGTTGIAIGWAGFEGIRDERGTKDLFGKEMEYTKLAVADNLASSANLLMGETDASIPFVIVRGFDAEFTEKEFSADDYYISPSECIFKAFYKK